jgi:hypothetical protein
LRNQIDQQVLQLRQDVGAFGHAISLKKKLRRCAGFAPDPISQPLTTVKPHAHQFKRVEGKRAKTKAPSHTETQNS